jgi:signal transduction histidine kinase
VRLLVRNLIENALRHSSETAAPVDVSFGRQSDKVFLQVKDHGEGIPPEDLERVTEPFYRADPARSRHTGGFGLGLYLCRRIVEAHGGELIITSQQGVGTTARASMRPFA